MKRKIPRRVPRILPLVGHRNDIGVVEMFPLVIATAHTLRRRLRCCRITIQPLLDDVVIELFGPEHACECLTHNKPRVSREVFGNYAAVKLIGFAKSIGEGFIELCESLWTVELLIR